MSLTLLALVDLQRNLLAEIRRFLTSQRCVPLAGSLEQGFEPLPLQTLASHRRVLGPQGRQLPWGDRIGGRRKQRGAEAVGVVAEEGALGREGRERLRSRFLGRGERDGNLGDRRERKRHVDAADGRGDG